MPACDLARKPRTGNPTLERQAQTKLGGERTPSKTPALPFRWPEAPRVPERTPWYGRPGSQLTHYGRFLLVNAGSDGRFLNERAQSRFCNPWAAAQSSRSTRSADPAGMTRRCPNTLCTSAGGKSRDEVRHNPALETKRQIAEIAKQGHFEDLESLNVRDAVSPFWIAAVVPHLPEKTAHQCRQGRQRHRVPLSSLKFLQDASFAEQHL
jgi:hypothetical protein